MTGFRMIWAFAIAVMVCVLGYFSLSGLRSRHSTAVSVSVLNSEDDCLVLIPAPAKGQKELQKKLCREVPNYLGDEVNLPLRSTFEVIISGNLTRAITEDLIEPMQQRGYRFGGVSVQDIGIRKVHFQAEPAGLTTKSP